MAKSPFPKYDPEKANTVFKQNLHVSVILIFISILYACASIGCIVKLSSPQYTLRNMTGGQAAETTQTWVIWINLWLFIIATPTLLIMALKKDYLYGPWAPLKGIPLILTALTELVILGIQGMKWSVDWMEVVLLVGLPLTIYLLCFVLGLTEIGKNLFLPFRAERRHKDIEWAFNMIDKPPVNSQELTVMEEATSKD
jgi:hypothetical protein